MCGLSTLDRSMQETNGYYRRLKGYFLCYFNISLQHRHVDVRTQQSQYVGPMLSQCWSTVYDAGPTLAQHRANVLCLLGPDIMITLNMLKDLILCSETVSMFYVSNEKLFSQPIQSHILIVKVHLIILDGKIVWITIVWVAKWVCL